MLLSQSQTSIFALEIFRSQNLKMNELKRQAYLGAMGIQTYFPRMRLAGAKPSPAYAVQVETKADLPTVEVTSVTEDSPAVAQLKSLASSGKKPGVSPLHAAAVSLRDEQNSGQIQSKPSRGRSPQEYAEVPQQTKIDVEPDNELRFSLLYFRINEKLAVIDELPHQISGQLNKESLILLKAILAALGQHISNTDLKAELFSWPLDTGYSMKNSPAIEAGKALSGFLQMRQEIDGFDNLLVFAGQVESLMLNQKNTRPEHDFESDRGYFITVTSSLHSILAVPTLKRDVWQKLQSLRSRINKPV